jgi:hypothetical protein
VINYNRRHKLHLGWGGLRFVRRCDEGRVGFIKLIKKSVLELVVSMGLMVVVAI